MATFFIVFLGLFLCVGGFHLSGTQMANIDRLIRTPGLTTKQRSMLDSVLYRSYEKWAVKKATDFRRLHRNKCRNIPKADLILSSKIGLYKAIKNYNGKYYLLNYSHLYVKRELLNMVSARYSDSIIPLKTRSLNKAHFSKEEMEQYNRDLEKTTHQYAISWTGADLRNKESYNCTGLDEETWAELWSRIDDLDPKTKRIIRLKYEYDFTRQFSNREVAELNGCSEETVRQAVLKGLLRFRLGRPVF
jgi:RNA polymerase sigma factor (sigma-70 family)